MVRGVSPFMLWYRTVKHRLYLCNGPHCSVRGARALRSALDTALWDAGILAETQITISGCQDHCDHGPNLLVQPGGCRYVALDAERLRAVVQQHLAGNTPIAEWLATPEMRRSGGG